MSSNGRDERQVPPSVADTRRRWRRWRREQERADQGGGHMHPPSAARLVDAGAMVRLTAVTKTFETAAGPFTALHAIDLSIGAGEFVAIVGKSGSGKSTLVNMITGIDRPTTGEVWVAGTPVHTLTENELARWRGRYLGIVFQFFQLLPTLTAAENIMLPMDFGNVYAGRERRARARALLESVDMAPHADKLPSSLSGGEQQRVAIARALANDPPLLVADEPTGNLDSHTAEAVFALFAQLVGAGKTILMVTHDVDLARQVSRTITIADGVMVGDEAQRARAPAPGDDRA
jgi:putative ABC transport system ATP-binding protein